MIDTIEKLIIDMVIEKEKAISQEDFPLAVVYRDSIDHLRKALKILKEGPKTVLK